MDPENGTGPILLEKDPRADPVPFCPGKMNRSRLLSFR